MIWKFTAICLFSLIFIGSPGYFIGYKAGYEDGFEQLHGPNQEEMAEAISIARQIRKEKHDRSATLRSHGGR